MRADLTHHDAAPEPDALQREGLRLLAALAALVAAALVVAGGLLWREHARGRPHVQATSVNVSR